MSGRWKEVEKLIFKGKRFEDSALDASALTEIIQYQTMVTETAKAQWRAANPDRERLQWHFEEQMQVYLRGIEPGSTVARMEARIPDTGELPLSEPELPIEIKHAVDTVRRVHRALEKEEALPDDFPRSLIPIYANWGKGITEEDECIEISGDGGEPARVTPKTRTKWTEFSEAKYEDAVDIDGEVLEAEVKKRNFQIWKDERTCVTVVFTPEQEDLVTEALKDHRTRRLQVKGRGEFIPPQGILERIKHVEDMRLLPIGEPEYDTSARPIEDILVELAKEVPEGEWKKLPADLTDNLDHYLYGGPKQ